MTHSWPVDEPFTSGTTAYADHLSAWLKGSWWPVATNLAHPTLASNYSSGFNAADLHDAFSPNPTVSSQATPASNPASYLWRALDTSGDVTVTVALQARVLNGSAHLGQRLLPTAWVIARAGGGTYDASTNSTNNLTQGYVFGWISDPTREAAWYLIRIDAGPTLTVLDSKPFRGSGLLTNEIDPTQLNELELFCDTLGSGNVRLVGRYRKPKKTGGQLEVEVFDFTDSSGSKITAAGRVGFAVSGQFNAAGSPGGAACALVNFFQVADAGTVVLREEWSRSWKQAALAHAITLGATTYDGWSMMQSFAGDWFGPAAYDRKILRSQVGGLTNRICFKPDTEPTGSGAGAGGFLVSQRRATDPRSQNRSLQVRFSTLQSSGAAGTTDPTTFRAGGIVARLSTSSSPSTTFLPSACYLALMYRDDASPLTQIQLYRFNDGAPTLLAETSPFTINVDTDYTFRFDVFNQLDSSGAPLGSTVLRLFVGGVQVVLVAVDTSVDVNAAGTVVDGTSERIVSGSLEGIYCFIPDGNRTVFLDTWTEGALTNSLVGTEADQASIAVFDEVEGHLSRTYEAPIAFGLAEPRPWARRVATFESGHQARGAVHDRQRRVWTAAADALTTAQRDEILDLWREARGCQLSFDFLPFGEVSTVKAHFVDDRIGTRLRAPSVYGYGEVEIEELFDT